MTEEEMELIARWIVQNVDAADVPGDEGNSEGLVYNLIHHLWDGNDYQQYEYTEEQLREVYNLSVKYSNPGFVDWSPGNLPDHKTKRLDTYDAGIVMYARNEFGWYLTDNTYRKTEYQDMTDEQLVQWLIEHQAELLE